LEAVDEVKRELGSIRPEFQQHPDVLEVRWALAANAGDWNEALLISESIIRLAPGKPEGWIYRGSALAEMNRHADAYTVLFQGHQRFPQDEIPAYDLACVCCAMGRNDEAAEWIRKAVVMAGEEIRRRALDDPDLEQIHDRLRSSEAD
jgi:tetratricopeptide (TPR) repeat protein